jgi:hypothetical protein
VVAPDEVVREVEGPLVDVDLAEVHREVEVVVDSGIAVGLEIAAEAEAVVDLSLVEGGDQGEALVREEAASEGEDESIFYLQGSISRSLADQGSAKTTFQIEENVKCGPPFLFVCED